MDPQMTPLRAPRLRATYIAISALAFVLFAIGCATPQGTAALVVGTTLAGGRSPANEIEEVYYLGVFDSQEQIPPAVYRLTVRGQASAISFTRFASGWVPANLVDTLNTSFTFKEKGAGLEVDDKGASGATAAHLETGRRLIMFGPEGFREAPRDHRLAIVMGSNPEKFFDAIGSGLATVTQAQVAQKSDAARSLLLEEMLRLTREQDRLKAIQASATAADTTATTSASTSTGAKE